MKRNLVSFIIPVYNIYEFLEETIHSIKLQDYNNIEIIVIDDGSNKEAKENIIRICKKHPNLLLIHKKNKGQALARKKGVEIATGDYIMFIDADDLLAESAVSNLVNSLENNLNCIASYGIKTKYYIGGKVKFVIPSPEEARNGNILPALLKGVPLLSNGNICIKKEYIEKVEFPKNIQQGEDWITWCRLALLGDIIFIDKLVLKIRSHENNISNQIYKEPNLLFKMLPYVFEDKQFIEKIGAKKIAKYYKIRCKHIYKSLYYILKERGRYLLALKYKILWIFSSNKL